MFPQGIVCNPGFCTERIKSTKGSSQGRRDRQESSDYGPSDKRVAMSPPTYYHIYYIFELFGQQ